MHNSATTNILLLLLAYYSSKKYATEKDSMKKDATHRIVKCTLQSAPTWQDAIFDRVFAESFLLGGYKQGT